MGIGGTLKNIISTYICILFNLMTPFLGTYPEKLSEKSTHTFTLFVALSLIKC